MLYAPKIVTSQEEPGFDENLRLPEVNVVKWPAAPIDSPGIHVAFSAKDEPYFDQVQPTLVQIVKQVAVEEQTLWRPSTFLRLCAEKQVDLFRFNLRSTQAQRDEMYKAGYDAIWIDSFRTTVCLPLKVRTLREVINRFTEFPQTYAVPAILSLERLASLIHSACLGTMYLPRHLSGHSVREAVGYFLHTLALRRIIYSSTVSVKSEPKFDSLNVKIQLSGLGASLTWEVPMYLVVGPDSYSYICIEGKTEFDRSINRALVKMYPDLAQKVLFDSLTDKSALLGLGDRNDRNL